MYATADDYTRYVGAAPEGIDKLLEQTSDQVDSVTFNRVRGIGFESLTDYQKEMIKKAVCHQAAYRLEYGAYEGISSFSAGSVSVSLNNANTLNGQVISKVAAEYLKNTGLTTRSLSWRHSHV